MTLFMFGYPWLLWVWPLPDDAAAQHPLPDRPARTKRSWRIRGKRHAQNPTQNLTQNLTQDPAQDQARETACCPEPSADLAPWPGLRLLLPVTEDELITFGRELEGAHDVIGRLLAER